MIRSLFARVIPDVAERIDRLRGWDKVPLPLGLFVLEGIRMRLRQRNLYDTATSKTDYPPVPSLQGPEFLTIRTPDGTYNDLNDPRMGSAGTRFGRNVPLDHVYPSESTLLSPNPRIVSRELLTRESFIPATTLNVLAAAWLQFMVRDWFSHGKSPSDNPWQIPLEDTDPWPQKPMQIMRTPPDPTRAAGEEGPPTHINVESHWWDGSQIYGSTAAIQARVRSGQDGKLTTGAEGLVTVDPNADDHPIDQPGFWLGLALMHDLFTREHNAICDRLKAEYPDWSDEDLFQHARLINAALLAKIHTVEWTTALLGNPALQIGMRANWWGLAGETVKNLVGRISDSELISGIPGGPTDHFGVRYSLTEEFVAVYRMHPLIPDDFTFRSVATDTVLQQRAFGEITNRRAIEVMEQVQMPDILYSFGVSHPGAITLHNYPRQLQQFERPDGTLQDLGATDILRSRELGVPRYNEFRRLFHLNPIASFDDLTQNPVWREDLRRVYSDDVEQLDLMIGLFAENPPQGFAFSDTAFRVFVLMASRRLNSDRFFTVDFNDRVYTRAGMDWIKDNTMTSVILRHYPALTPAFRGVTNAFAPWSRTGT